MVIELTNENTNQNETNEVAEVQEQNLVTIERETEDYQIVRDEKGNFKRKAKFKDFTSVEPKTKQEKIWLLNVLEADEETGNGLKENVGKVIEVENIMTRTYNSIDEETGELINGVLTYLITPKKEVFVTSSKTVYFSITRIMDLFGTPLDKEWENIKIKVGAEKREKGTMIKIKMVE